jgi:hypothetical protein
MEVIFQLYTKIQLPLENESPSAIGYDGSQSRLGLCGEG